MLNYDPLEPIELRTLKRKLANLSKKNCKCLSKRPRYAGPISNFVLYNPNDKQVQVVTQPSRSFDRFTQIHTPLSNEAYYDAFAKDVLCPGCFVTMNLLRREVLKVVKDEESETKTEMFSCDKSTEKSVKAVEKTTSITAKPVIKFSNLTVNESSISESNSNSETKRSLQVKFHNSIYENRPIKQAIPSNVTCLCMENFVNSIRPSLDAYLFSD